MKISIVIPVYNVESYILGCLQSIAQQSYDGEIECILVDDCGSDKSVNIINDYIASYNGNIIFRLIHHNKNKGLSAARNTGIAAATGEYITFVDSDDELTPLSIEMMTRIAKKYPGVDLIQGDTSANIPDPRNYFNIVSASMYPEFSKDHLWCRANFLKYVPTSACSKFYRTGYLRENNLIFDEGKIHEDAIWKVHISRTLNSIAFCFFPVYYVRRDNLNSITHQSDRTKHYLGYLTVIETIFNGFCKNNLAAETLYATEYLRFFYKAYYWECIKDKKAINAKIKELRRTAKSKNLPKILKFMTSCLSVPVWLGNNPIIRFLYNRYVTHLKVNYI